MKIDLKIPKGTKCKGGVCEQDIEIEGLEIPEEKPIITRQIQPEINKNQLPPQSMQYQPFPEQHDHEHKKDIHEELSELLPRGQNFGKCANGNCATMVKNPNPVTKFKACPGCKNNAVPKNNDFCPTCGITENSKKFDEWEESDLELETEEDEE